jgi:DNA (cytosine-5)-methyltransferase 1
MRFLSVCSGIEAASVASAHLGWEAVGLAEIDPFCCSLLAEKYPTVRNYGDFTTIRGDELGPVDAIVGGTPCQDFSVAGKRAGLDGARGNLTLEFVRLVERVSPRWVFWENVPGVLSIDGGRAFGAFLGALAKLGYGFTWRVLNARHFGVPQRRRRLFLVGHLGAWQCAAAVLLDGGSAVDATGRGARLDAQRNRRGRGNVPHGQRGITGSVQLCGRERYLTPLECERLDGFPDHYTAITYNGKPASDRKRYKALGNSWAVPCVRWIFERMDYVDSIMSPAR